MRQALFFDAPIGVIVDENNKKMALAADIWRLKPEIGLPETWTSLAVGSRFFDVEGDPRLFVTWGKALNVLRDPNETDPVRQLMFMGFSRCRFSSLDDYCGPDTEHPLFTLSCLKLLEQKGEATNDIAISIADIVSDNLELLEAEGHQWSDVETFDILLRIAQVAEKYDLSRYPYDFLQCAKEVLL